MPYDPALAAIEANVYEKRSQQSRSCVGWGKHLTPFGVSLLSRMGWYRQDLPADKNPITEALKSPDFVQQFGKMKGFSRVAVFRVKKGE